MGKELGKHVESTCTSTPSCPWYIRGVGYFFLFSYVRFFFFNNLFFQLFLLSTSTRELHGQEKKEGKGNTRQVHFFFLRSRDLWGMNGRRREEGVRKTCF